MASIYDNIGPFRGVPENLRQLAAARANAAADIAVSAAIREAREMGEECHQHQAFFSSATTTTHWLGEFVHDNAVSCRSSIRTDLEMSFLVLSLTTLGAFSIASVGISDGHAVAGILAAVFIFAVIFLVVWGTALCGALRGRKEMREQGYTSDDLPKAAARIGGQCWLPATNVLHIVETREEGKPKVRTVFYDAIGRAVTGVQYGLEFVELTSKDGSFIAKLNCPQGSQIADAHGLARFITDRMSKSAAA